MKISFNWLKELVALPPGTTVAELARRLTLAGLEVESIDGVGREVSGVRIAEVRAVRPHPGADKLRIVRLSLDPGDDGAEQGTEVVCGAPNVPARGGRVAWAAPGATLPGGFKIGRKEIRGFDSPGMICSEKELGLSDAAEGILILPTTPAFPVGGDLIEALGIADDVMEVNVTPNRPDALSHVGIAREVAAAFGVSWRLPPVALASELAAASAGKLAAAGVASPSVSIADAGACPRYVATVIRGLAVGPSPAPVHNRLAACGVRSISNVVDATNYVMLETGHPLHAFDLDKIDGDIVVRRAAPGETLKTLDGVERSLAPDDIVIADARGPVALAGVMGGARAEVSTSTVNVLLEAATFDPRAVRKTAKRLGMHSEASHRFERGVDAEGVAAAAARAAAMLAALGAGQVAGPPIDRRGLLPRVLPPIVLPVATLAAVAGFEIPAALAVEKLRSVEFEAEARGDAIVVVAPTFRPDVTIPVDLVEEIMRLIGYDRAPARLPAGGKAPEPHPGERLADRARDILAALGLHEIAGWAFVPRAALEALGEQRFSSGITVQNPISSDYEVMRTSLLPGLAEAVKRNLSRGATDFGLFEVGPTISPAPGDAHHRHEMMAAGLIVGRRAGWLKPGEPVDFFDLKRIVTELFRGLGERPPSFSSSLAGSAPVTFMHPGVSAWISRPAAPAPGEKADGATRLGFAGQVHPLTARRFDLDVPVFYFEVELDSLVDDQSRAAQAVSLPRFPSVTRDVSFWIEAGVDADAQRRAMRASGEPLLREVAVLEDFRDPRFVPPGKKGMLWTLTYRADDKTLTDIEVDAAHGRVVSALGRALPIQIR